MRVLLQTVIIVHMYIKQVQGLEVRTTNITGVGRCSVMLYHIGFGDQGLRSRKNMKSGIWVVICNLVVVSVEMEVQVGCTLKSFATMWTQE